MNSLTKIEVKKKIVSKEFTVKPYVSTKSKSDVWKKFSKVYDKSGYEVGFVVCNRCNDVYAHGKNGNSVMLRHSCKGNQPCITINNIKTISFQEKRS